METNQNVNVENVETTTAEVENTQKDLKIDIETSNSEEQISDNQKPIEVKKEKKEEIIKLTTEQLANRLERTRNNTREEVVEELKKEFEEKLNVELDKTFKELETTKSETFKMKENLAITRELFKNDIDNSLDDDELEFIINKVKKEKTEDISYDEIIQKLKTEKPKYFKNNNYKPIIAPVNKNPIDDNNFSEAYKKYRNSKK